jgi:hypothetical protein
VPPTQCGSCVFRTIRAEEFRAPAGRPEGVGSGGAEVHLIRRIALVVATAVLLLVGLRPGGLELARATGDATRLVSLTNGERTSRGLPAYATASDLAAVAQAHAERMAERGTAYHNPALGSEVSNWQALAENVGYAGSVDDVHGLFMASSEHRAHILSTTYTEIGTGVAAANGYVYVVEVFRLPASSAPEPPPEEAAPPPPEESAPPATVAPTPTTAAPTTTTAPPPPTTAAPEATVPTTAPAVPVGSTELADAVPLRVERTVALPALPADAGPPAVAFVAAFLLAAVVAGQGVAVRRLRLA